MKKIVVFQDRRIRRIWHDDEWWFSVIDVVEALTESSNSRRYWSDLKRKLTEQEGFELYEKIVQLKLESPDGKSYRTDCANTKNMLRIIQSIPSKNAEPFKQWLAKVGYERVQEIENPELAYERAKKYYDLKGYPKDWIEQRVQSIKVRQELTDEWKKRDVTEEHEYAILTNEISTATFGIPIKEHKELKNLDPKFKNQNLRDHMTSLELVFNMLGEASTKEIAKEQDAQGFSENKTAAEKGGQIAGDARKSLEKQTGKSVVSKKNVDDIQKLT
ncbi:MAG: BRO family protein [Candidatus Woesearchaeota archaeon]|nr:BRO family protein [Candidatus Woesearchaeota archaeon]